MSVFMTTEDPKVKGTTSRELSEEEFIGAYLDAIDAVRVPASSWEVLKKFISQFKERRDGTGHWRIRIPSIGDLEPGDEVIVISPGDETIKVVSLQGDPAFA